MKKHILLKQKKARRAKKTFYRKESLTLDEYKAQFIRHSINNAENYFEREDTRSPLLTKKSFTKKLTHSTITIVISIFIVATAARAGSLTPSSSPAASSYTLGDVYARLTTNATTSAGNHVFAPSASPTSTLYDLTTIFNTIPTIDATKVASGTSYLGIAGTYTTSNLTTSSVATGTIFGVGLTGTLFGSVSSSQVCSTATYAGTLSPGSSTIAVGNTICGTAGGLLENLWNGTFSTFTGGSQANGGADDYNNGGAATSTRYSKSWTACSAGNSYCGTGLASADAKDDSTGLIWSLPCNGAGCDSFSDSSPMTYAWSSSTTNGNNFSTVQNATSTAAGLCTNGDHAESGWFLPHQKQILQAYVDGTYGNLIATGSNLDYWTATTWSRGSTSAHIMNLSAGGFGAGGAILLKTTGAVDVRCVR
ncbi:MAG: hypothetical protein AAB652_01135 [Patescibacteria group bacterium]